jgi:molybdopterin-guanine dinucleotide biosynthesis protein
MKFAPGVRLTGIPPTLAAESLAKENHEVANLDHVRWVGGGSGSGKTTMTRLLAERFGIGFYSTDATIRHHSERLEATGAPLLDRFRRMSMDERWIQLDPVTMYTTFPWFHGEGFELIIEDLQQMPTDHPVLVEGFRLLPHLVQPYVSNPRHAVWQVPTAGFRQASFKRRPQPDAFWMRTTDPDRALTNLLERDGIFSDKIASDAAFYGLEVLHVDGTRTVDTMADELVSRFGLHR